jgi:hypothetical protein
MIDRASMRCSSKAKPCEGARRRKFSFTSYVDGATYSRYEWCVEINDISELLQFGKVVVRPATDTESASITIYDDYVE